MTNYKPIRVNLASRHIDPTNRIKMADTQFDVHFAPGAGFVRLGRKRNGTWTQTLFNFPNGLTKEEGKDIALAALAYASEEMKRDSEGAYSD